jgi:hypothetical protein
MENAYNEFVSNLDLYVQAFNYVQVNSNDLEKRVRLLSKNEEVMSERLEALVASWEKFKEEAQAD